MKTRTLIDTPVYDFKLNYKETVFSLGSCFSEHIASRLAYLQYNVFNNPCGITFNPASLLTALKTVENPKSLHESQLIKTQGLWAHPDFHGSFNQLSTEAYMDRASEKLYQAQNSLKDASLVIITVGTCYAYRSKDTDRVVNNCHKLPSAHFDLELFDLDTTIEYLTELRETALRVAPHGVKFLWTVSPVRHIKNGLVRDRRSKSTALLAVHEMVDSYSDSYYFPSYEILVDDLRDYRYYEEDLIHPSKVAVDHVFDIFQESILDPSEGDLRKKIQSIVQRQQHRPLFPESAVHQQFLNKLEEDRVSLKSAYPDLNLGV